LSEVNEMERKKTVLAVGFGALLVFSLVAAASATGTFGKKGMRGFGAGFAPGDRGEAMAGLGLPEDATHEQVMDAMWQKRLADLGLTERSSVGQYREAVKAGMQERMEQRKTAILDKLGLSEDASEQQIRDAMQQWKPEKAKLMGSRPGKARAGCAYPMGAQE
jgi:hypothetical protein